MKDKIKLIFIEYDYEEECGIKTLVNDVELLIEDLSLQDKIDQILFHLNILTDIHVNHWHWTCGDGCCDDYGVDIFVNGVEMETRYENLEQNIQEILEHLGYEVEIIRTYEEE